MAFVDVMAVEAVMMGCCNQRNMFSRLPVLELPYIIPLNPGRPRNRYLLA
jgi:hypothetical protein